MALYQDWQTAFLATGTAAFALLLGVGLRLLLSRLGQRMQTTQHVWADGLLSGAALPVQILVWILGAELVADIFIRDGTWVSAQSPLSRSLAPVRDVLVIFVVMWLLLRVIQRIQDKLMMQSRARGREIDPTAADAIGKLSKAVVVILAILSLMQALGFSVAGLLAFGGMGGIAVGFAAQSLVANLLGGLTIFASRPFKVGDYVIIPGTELAGAVEHVGWRATRLLGFDCKPFYVPNALFNTQPVINHSRMTCRRIMEDIHIRYADMDAIPAIVADGRALLGSHPGIRHDFFAFNFSSCGTYSLKLSVYAFTVSTDYNEYMNVQEDVLLQIADIIRRHGAHLTGPVSSVQLPPDNGGKAMPGPDGTPLLAPDLAAMLAPPPAPTT